MDEISGALVGIVLVLTAVFLPMAAFGGSTGVIYRQFSITIVAAMWLSVLVAMVMTPALCASMLKPTHKGHERGPAAWFNRTFDRLTNGYIGGVKWLIRVPVVSMIGFALLTGLVAFLFMRVPGGFLPDEDQGSSSARLPCATGNPGADGRRQPQDHRLRSQDLRPVC